MTREPVSVFAEKGRGLWKSAMLANRSRFLLTIMAEDEALVAPHGA